MVTTADPLPDAPYAKYLQELPSDAVHLVYLKLVRPKNLSTTSLLGYARFAIPWDPMLKESDIADQ